MTEKTGPFPDSDFGAPHRRRARLFTGSAILLAIGLWNLPSLWYPFEEGHALSQLIGRIIVEGGVPYRDALDVKPPGIFYLHALLIWVGGDGMHWLRVADLIFLWSTMVFMMWIGVRLHATNAGQWGALLFGLSYPLMGFWKMAQPESFLLPFLGLSLLMALSGWEDPRHHWKLMICGISLGVVFWFKYPYALPLGVLGLALILKSRFKPERLGTCLRSIVFLCGGFLIVLAAGMIFMWAVGGLDEMLKITLEYNIAERLSRVGRMPLARRSLFHWGLLGKIPLYSLTAVLSGIGFVCLWRKRPHRWWMLPAYALSMLAAIYAQMRLYHYHWVPLLPFVCLLAGIALSALFDWLMGRGVVRSSLKRRALVGVLVFIMVMVGLGTHRGEFRRWWLYVGKGMSWEAYLATFPDLEMRFPRFLLEDWHLARVLKEMDPPDKTLFIWGFRPLVYYFSGLKPSTPFLYTLSLNKMTSRGAARRNQLMESLRTHPPAAIVIHMTRGRGWRETLGDLRGQFSSMYQLLRSNYLLYERIGRFLIYVRTDYAIR